MIDARSRDASIKRAWLAREIEAITGMSLEVLRHKLASGYRLITPEAMDAIKDLEHVIRCKDCGYYHKKEMVCDRPCEGPVIRCPDAFCSSARRRNEDGET